LITVTGVEAKAKASGLRGQGQGQGQTSSRPRPRPRFFVLEPSLRSRTVLEDPIPGFSFTRTFCEPRIMMSIPSLSMLSSMAYSVRERSINHGDTVVRVPSNGRIQSLKKDNMLNSMLDNLIRAAINLTQRQANSTFSCGSPHRDVTNLEYVGARRSQTPRTHLRQATMWVMSRNMLP